MSGDRYALIVATDTYQDNELEHLLSPSQDAIALADVLGDQEVGGFDVKVLHNKPAHVVARRVEDFFADSGRNDSLLLQFSCHGLKNASGELFFAASDTVPNRLSSTAVPADFVRRCMKESRARNTVLLLDCCYGGAFMEGMGTRAGGDVNVFDSFQGAGVDSGVGWAVITASNAMEYAFEGDRLAATHQVCPSVFTHVLTSGLASGEADLDADGRVSINELYDYVYDRVRQENPHQTPSRSIHLQGDVYLARSRRRRTDEAGLPEDLRRAVASSDVFSRRGAIPELRMRLESTDRKTAEAACRALQGLVRNDIKPIADEASRALDEAVVRPSPAVLDFGRVEQFGPVPHRRVRLLGPPLARDCVPRSSEDRIHVVVQGDALDVSVDTTRPGGFETELLLEGRAGAAPVSVRVDVVPVRGAASARPGPLPPPRPQVTGIPGSRYGAPPQRPRPVSPSAPRAVQAIPPPRSAVPGAPPAVPSVPRSVSTGHPPAGLRLRFTARIIDYLLVFLFALGLVFFAAVAASFVPEPERVMEILSSAVATLFFFGWGLLLFLYDWLYLRYRGATFGKMLVGIKVVDVRDGGPLSHGQAAGRAAFFGLPQTIPLLGNLAVLLESLAAQADPRRRALHDRGARTLVVHVQK
ncbi:RDD family protein [Nocardiopsis sp. NPDC006139]|uniref:caspase, EACC1-associated type n=1 Tax=Nocardiopsis sp. NPDC006139 TaxID=3154578 RepID=UPI0033A3CD64